MIDIENKKDWHGRRPEELQTQYLNAVNDLNEQSA